MTLVCWDLPVMLSLGFLPSCSLYYTMLLRSTSRNELPPFHFLFVRLTFPSLLKYPFPW